MYEKHSHPPGVTCAAWANVRAAWEAMIAARLADREGFNQETKDATRRHREAREYAMQVCPNGPPLAGKPSWWT